MRPSSLNSILDDDSGKIGELIYETDLHWWPIPRKMIVKSYCGITVFKFKVGGKGASAKLMVFLRSMIELKDIDYH